MSEDKAKTKTKIDLKARLNKTGMGLQAPAMPLPVPGAPPSNPDSGPGSAPPPAPSVPVAAASAPGVIPAPVIAPLPSPFAPAQPAQPAPAPAPKPTAAQQTIKVEVSSDEIEQERKKAGKKVAIVGAIGAAIGILIGFVAGGQKAVADRGAQAVAGAGALKKDVEAANVVMKKLSEKMQAATKALGEKQFPDDVINELGALNVPFDDTTLDGKYVGSLNSKTLRNLLAYTKGVDDLNKKKDTIRALLTQAKTPITKAWAEAENPVANFSVTFRNDGDKLIGELVPNKEPFKWKDAFPASYTVVRLENNRGAEKKANRYTGKGDLVQSDPVVIPIDPKTVAGFTSEALIQQLNKAIFDTRRVLEGQTDDPNNETVGLLKRGEDLVQELNRISQAK